MADVAQQARDLLHHHVDGVDDAAQHVGRDLAAPGEVALGDLHGGVEEALDVVLQLLALALFLVALGLGHDLRAQAHDGVVEGVGQQADLVAGLHLDRLAEVAAAHPLGHPDDVGDRTGEAAREERAGQSRHQGDAGEHRGQEPARAGGGVVDDRAVHADPHRAQRAAEHRHADVDDAPGLAGHGVGVVDVPHLLGDVAGHHVLVHHVRRHERHEGVGDLGAVGVVHHDVGHAADRRRTGRSSACTVEASRVRIRSTPEEARLLAMAVPLEVNSSVMRVPQGLHRDQPGHRGQRDQHRGQEQDDLRQQSEPRPQRLHAASP